MVVLEGVLACKERWERKARVSSTEMERSISVRIECSRLQEAHGGPECVTHPIEMFVAKLTDGMVPR